MTEPLQTSSEVRTFLVDGKPYGVVWVDHGYRSGPKVTLFRSLGAIPFVPEAALTEVETDRDSLRLSNSDLSVELELMTKDRDALRSGIRSEVERLREQHDNDRVAARRAREIEGAESSAAGFACAGARSAVVANRLEALLGETR